MNKDYQSFINGSAPEPEYDCRELYAGDYVLRARCNKTNPDCEKYLNALKTESADIKIKELDVVQHGKDMIDIWVRKQNLFRKTS